MQKKTWIFQTTNFKEQTFEHPKYALVHMTTNYKVFFFTSCFLLPPKKREQKMGVFGIKMGAKNGGIWVQKNGSKNCGLLGSDGSKKMG